MKKLLVISTSLLSTAVMAVMPVNQPVGSSFTLSSAPNQRALATSLNNPAAPFLMVNEQDNDSFRFGIFGPLSISAEMGDVSDLDDQIEDLEDILDNGSGATDQAKANAILDEIGNTAYIKTSASLQIPLMPIIYKTKNSGAFMLDASISAIAKGSLLADEVNASLNTETSLYAQTATDLNIGFGYSQAILKNSQGVLVGGVKANLHRISSERALAKLDDSTDVDDAISDGLSDNSVNSTGIGLDLGAIWVSEHYQAGLTLANINEPDFDTASIVANAASNNYGISSTDSYTMEMQATIDLAVALSNKQVMLGMTYDANSVEDAVGDEYQWAAVSLSYYGDSHFLPGIRAGFRQNLAGSELSYVSGGLTLFKRLNLDLAVSLDTVEDDEGSSSPRSFYLSLGYDTAF
jgi:hypothetical protein